MMNTIPSDTASTCSTSATTVLHAPSRLSRSEPRHQQMEVLHSDWGAYSPVVSAMLRDNRMGTCADVGSVLADCIAAGSNASICKTAASYYETCMNSRTDDNDDF